eukprot:SAG31_NODE_882_length_11260_cov_3.357104_5_plen_149_part_00
MDHSCVVYLPRQSAKAASDAINMAVVSPMALCSWSSLYLWLTKYFCVSHKQTPHARKISGLSMANDNTVQIEFGQQFHSIAAHGIGDTPSRIEALHLQPPRKCHATSVIGAAAGTHPASAAVYFFKKYTVLARAAAACAAAAPGSTSS